jgi:hypothetical protein
LFYFENGSIGAEVEAEAEAEADAEAEAEAEGGVLTILVLF